MSYDINRLANVLANTVQQFRDGTKAIAITEIGGSKYITMEDNK